MIGKKLLVADDSLTIQKVIKLALSNEGYEIKTVSDGKDTLELIKTFLPDALLIDVGLPGKSPFEIKREIEKLTQKPKIILMSSAFEKVDESQVLSAQFEGRLTKPFDPAHLRKVLTEALQETKPTESLAGFQLGNLPPLDPEAEIKKLTETTFKMNESPNTPFSVTSAADDFSMNWSISENAKKPFEENPFSVSSSEPSLPPYTSLSDLGGTNFDLRPGLELEAKTSQAPEMEPLPNLNHSETLDPFTPLQEPLEIPEPLVSREYPHEIQDHRYPPPSPSHPLTGIDPERLEQMIRDEVTRVLRELAQKTLPEVAEKVIKEEIHRMLEERPH